MANWSIHPLDLGTVAGFEKSLLTLRRNHGQAIDVPCLAFVVTGGSGTVLVDTGPCDPQRAAAYHRPLVRSAGQELRPALAGIGIEPERIDLVVFTHLHWDHCFNLERLSRAEFVVQQRERDYAYDPLPADRAAYEAGVPGLRPPWASLGGRLRLVEGEVELLPGLRTIPLPGHTPGSQGVAVDTGEGVWVIAGDAVPLAENWGGGDQARWVPNGIYHSLADCYASFARLAPFGDRVLPGHEPGVAARRVYP
jgi:glyoxylase-like metal-dependent hydrolase (beta-lactamase superfamily II)